MANRVHRVGENGAGAWFSSLPPVTKLYGVVCFGVTLGMKLGVVNPYLLMLTWAHVKRFQVRFTLGVQSRLNRPGLLPVYCTVVPSSGSGTCVRLKVWRLVTTFFVLGNFSLHFVFMMLWM
jgi:hypothetical protein